MTIDNGQRTNKPPGNPREILQSLDRRRFIRPNRPEQGILLGKVNLSILSLDLYDSNGAFCGCYITGQLSFVGTDKFEEAIQII